MSNRTESMRAGNNAETTGLEIYHCYYAGDTFAVNRLRWEGLAPSYERHDARRCCCPAFSEVRCRLPLRPRGNRRAGAYTRVCVHA